MIKFNIITIFPEALDLYLKTSLLGRAQKNKLIKVNLINLRDFTSDKHKSVDDKAYGGGPGMVVKVEPIYKAVEFAKGKGQRAKRKRIILFSTRGKKFTNKIAKRLALCNELILICGRYEGADERVAKHIADEEISIGDFVLSGGELPALVLVEAVSRHIKGVLGKMESLEEIKGSYPVYTRPAVFMPKKARRPKGSGSRPQSASGWKVPPVLLSGDHKKIEKWRRAGEFKSENSFLTDKKNSVKIQNCRLTTTQTII